MGIPGQGDEWDSEEDQFLLWKGDVARVCWATILVWDFLDKGVGAVSTCTCTMSRVCDHTFGQRGGGRVQPQSTACSLWGVLLSVLVILSVH